MKTNNGKMRISLLALAVEGALFAMCALPAHADDEEVAALKIPTNFVEIGASNVSQNSAKFGEYTGMNKSGGNLIGNFSVRGGDAYGDGNGTKLWSITGADLGLTSRTVSAAISNQGQWNLGIVYDELTHNISNTYQTPYQGSMGGNSFTLPAGFLFTTATAGLTRVGTEGTANMAKIQAALHTVDVATARKNTSLSAGLNLNEQWDIKFDFKHLDQSGAKLMSFGSMANKAAAPTVTNEVISILPNPTNYKTDTINLALNWVGDKAHMTASYFGSFFRDGYDRVTFQTFAGAVSSIETMSTAPSNDFHQFNLSGGYAFSPQTKMTGGLSYGRNTQNDAFVDALVYAGSPMVTAAPKSSLDGLVISKHADLKLINQTTKDLSLSAGMKYDERDDRTASNFYNFNALDYAANHQANFANTPFSNKKTQLELAGDYRLGKDQHLRLAYNREDVKRWCDQYAVGGLGPYLGAAATAGVNSYPAGTNCVVATASSDDKLSATYKIKAGEDVNLNAGYSFSKRVTTSDPNAITARLGLNGNPNLASSTNAAGTAIANSLVQGLNAGDFRGFYPFFDASRKEQMLKAGVNWQANEKLSLALGGRYTDDQYDSLYGEQKGNSWSLNLDSSYAYSENGSISTYLTQQHRQRDMTDLQKSPTILVSNAGLATQNGASTTAVGIPPGATWSDNLKDDETTIGLGAKQGGLMGAKLELAGDLTYSLGKTGYGTQLNYATTTSVGGFTCSSPAILSCGQLPDIKNAMLQLKFTGKYKIDKSSKFAFGYVFQQMKSNDYYYNGLQLGSTPSTLMPTNQQAPSYTVNVISAAYVRNF